MYTLCVRSVICARNRIYRIYAMRVARVVSPAASCSKLYAVKTRRHTILFAGNQRQQCIIHRYWSSNVLHMIYAKCSSVMFCIYIWRFTSLITRFRTEQSCRGPTVFKIPSFRKSTEHWRNHYFKFQVHTRFVVFGEYQLVREW